MNSLVRNVAAAFTLGLVIGGPIGMAQAASSAHRTFDGKIAAISKVNVKVMGMEGGKMQTIGFVFKPPVGGKQTHDPSKLNAKMLHVGEYVRVIYDQKLLGLRHADSIEPYANPAMKLKN